MLSDQWLARDRGSKNTFFPDLAKAKRDVMRIIGEKMKINSMRERAAQAIEARSAAFIQDMATAIQFVVQTPMINSISGKSGIEKYLLWTVGPIVYQSGFF
jgi:hypothetical protein